MFLANYLIMDWNSSGRCAAASISAERQPSVMGEKKMEGENRNVQK